MTCTRSLRALSACALSALVSGCFPQASSTSGPQATATPASTAAPLTLSTAPVYVASRPPAKPKARPTVTARPLPSVTPYHAVASSGERPIAIRAPLPAIATSNAPRILAIHINEVDIHSGDTVNGDVQTTSGVSHVEIRIGAWSMPLPRAHPGLFVGSGSIPQLPFFVQGKYTLQVIARNAAGLYAERDIPITLH